MAGGGKPKSEIRKERGLSFCSEVNGEMWTQWPAPSETAGLGRRALGGGVGGRLGVKWGDDLFG